MFSYFEPISLKNSFGKVVFQILAKIELTRNKNRLFGHHFETLEHFLTFFFCRNVIFFIVHTYKMQISLQNSEGKVVFLGRFMEPSPWALTGIKVPWSLLSDQGSFQESIQLTLKTLSKELSN